MLISWHRIAIVSRRSIQPGLFARPANSIRQSAGRAVTRAMSSEQKAAQDAAASGYGAQHDPIAKPSSALHLMPMACGCQIRNA